MFRKYFKFTRKRVAFFCILMIGGLGFQDYKTGNQVYIKQENKQPGNSKR